MKREVKEGLKDAGVEAGKLVARPLIKAIGDAMERSKRPFWRKLVAIFRGTKGS